MFITLADLRDALRGAQDHVESMIVGYLARSFPRGTIYSVSTADSGEQLLVDQARLWGASDDDSNEDAETEVGRIEQAGFLTIPQLNEPAQCFGDTRNAAYIPLSSAKYRPGGGQPGDTAHYSLSDATPAVIWNRQSGQGTWDSAGGAHLELDQTEPRLRAKRTLHADHYAGNDLFPVATPGPALGTAPAGVALVSGTDAAMTMSMTITDPTAAPGLLCTIVFGAPYDGEPHLLGPFPKSLNLATPPPGGVSGTMYAVVIPNACLLFNTVTWTPGTYRFSFGVMGNKA